MAAFRGRWVGSSTVVTFYRARAVSTMANSLTGDAHSREATLEASAGARHMFETLTVKTMARIRNTNLHMKPVPCTMYVLG